MDSIFQRRLAVVVGKGGTGKSLVSAALALAAARKGLRVLVCEVNTRERISALLEAPPVGHALCPIGREGEAIDAVVLNPQEAMREYALMVLKYRSLYSAVFENAISRAFLRAIPSLAELVMLGKLLFHVREERERGVPRYDLTILDAPATGHGLALLRLPQTLLLGLSSGPMAEEVRAMRALLCNPAFTAALLVSLPESMPVVETLELGKELRGLEIACAGAILNGASEPLFTGEELQRLDNLPSALLPLAAAAREHERRAVQSSEYAARLSRELSLGVHPLPWLPTPRLGRAEVEQLSRRLEVL